MGIGIYWRFLMKWSAKEIRQELLETAQGYQMPEGMLDIITVVADKLDIPRSRVSHIAYRTNFPHETY
jgi:hypothetical protein